MSDEKEKLEYKIKKTHRKKLQQKLGEIQKELSESQATQQKMATKRRRENIYVLFALAIIGGFLSITPDSSAVIDPLFVRTFGIFALASVIFIIIKINTVALYDISYIKESEKNLDDYADYLFIFSINGIFILITFATAVDTLDIEISQVQPYAFFLVVTLISAILSLIVGYYRNKKRRKELSRLSEYVHTSEEAKQELQENIISGIKNIGNANTKQEEINEFGEIAPYIQQSRNKFFEPEDYKPILEELDDLELESDELENSIRESLVEARNYVRNKVMQEASIDEKQQRFEEKYENMVFDESK